MPYFSQTITVPVKMQQTPAGDYLVNILVKVQPAGKSARTAKPNECSVKFYRVIGGGNDAFLAQTNTTSIGVVGGNAAIVYPAASMKFPSEYKVKVAHLASGAEVEWHWTVDAAGNASAPWENTKERKEGTAQPATFSQPRPLSRGYRRA